MSALHKISYGLYVLTAKDGDKDNGCIINTAAQVTVMPEQISVAVNKKNLTHDMIKKNGKLVVSILKESTPFSVFECFGFVSGKDVYKFDMGADIPRMENGVCYVSDFTNAAIAGVVVKTMDCGTHTIFIAEVTQSLVFNDEPSVTYQYYFDHIKPKPAVSKKAGYICKICGYVYDGEPLPDDFICPICKHGAADFEKL
jgi:flavin reductase (DIM6/NTAB) family NADH-FMN oxidoreductase RutF